MSSRQISLLFPLLAPIASSEAPAAAHESFRVMLSLGCDRTMYEAQLDAGVQFGLPCTAISAHQHVHHHASFTSSTKTGKPPTSIDAQGPWSVPGVQEVSGTCWAGAVNLVPAPPQGK